MPSFPYIAVDSKGKKRPGSVEAATLSEAKEKLRRQGLIVLSFGEKLSIFNWKREVKLNEALLFTFTSQLKELVGAKIPLYDSLVSIDEQYHSESQKKIFQGLCETVKSGASLSKAMMKFPTSFSVDYIGMIEAGEKGGSLSDSLEKLSFLLQRQIKIKKQLKNALIYPMVLSIFSCVILFSLLFFVVPSLAPIFEGHKLNPLTASVFALSHFFKDQWYISLPLFSLLIAAGICTFKNKKVKEHLLKLPYKLPLLKKITFDSALSRFCRTFATLSEGGISMVESLQRAKKVMKHPYLEETITRAEKDIVKGIRFSKAISSPHIPTLMIRMIAIGEESGQLPKMMHKIGEFYEDELEKTLNRLTTLAQPIILIIMGILVGIIMMSVLLPLTDVNSFL